MTYGSLGKNAQKKANKGEAGHGVCFREKHIKST
jgi:hypothetical protein